jgi:hypothetical protein
MMPLAQTRAQDLRWLLPVSPTEAFAALQAEAARLSPAHAALFAAPGRSMHRASPGPRRARAWRATRTSTRHRAPR